MRSFKIPYGKIIKDKIIYGRFTIKQALYIGSIFLVIAKFFLLDTSKNKEFSASIIITKIVVLIIYSIIVLILSFKKKDIYDLDEYLLMKIKYKLRRYKNIVYEKY